jgi:VanZ family protein
MTRPTERAALPAGFRPVCLLLAAVLVFQLFYLGSQPFAAGLILPPWDKFAHLGVFAAIAALLWFATEGRAPVLVIAAVMLIGALDEIHQASLPGRTADILDFLTDTCAALATVMLLRLQRRVPT